MAIDKETEKMVLVLLGISVLSKVGDLLNQGAKLIDEAGNTLKQGGASLYEVLHPSEVDHANDLPGKRIPKEAIKMIAQMAGFPDPNFAAAIAMAESNGYPNAIARSSREISVGLWQINTMVHPYTPAQMADPMQNAAAAYKISKGGTNWKPWSVFTNGRYKQFL